MNKFKEYGFKRKLFTEVPDGAEGQSLKGLKYGYTYTKKIDDVTITLNIIPQGNEWICEAEKVDNKLYKEWQKHNSFSYDNSYKKVTRWAYMATKERALDEIIYQYDYLFSIKA